MLSMIALTVNIQFKTAANLFMLIVVSTWMGDLEGWVDLGDLLHTEMVYQRRSPIQVLTTINMNKLAAVLNWMFTVKAISESIVKVYHVFHEAVML